MPGRRHLDLAWVRLRIGDKFWNAFCRNRWVDQHDERLPCNRRDWRDVAQKIEFKLIVDGGIYRVRGTNHQKRISVSRRTRDSLGSNVTGSARSILDDDWLT